MALALSILIPGTQCSETEKVEVNKLIGKSISFFSSSSLLVTVSFACASDFPTQRWKEGKEGRGPQVSCSSEVAAPAGGRICPAEVS